jgi:hypothetical protein
VPDVTEWARWARAEGDIDTRVVDFVEAHPDIFADPDANPRAWKYVSDIIKKWQPGKYAPDLLAIALSGLVGDTWAVVFHEAHSGAVKPLRPQAILEQYPVYRPAFRQWVADRRLDLVAASLEGLKRHIQPQQVYESVLTHKDRRKNVETFFADLPPDLKQRTGDWLEDKGFRGLTVRGRGKV